MAIAHAWRRLRSPLREFGVGLGLLYLLDRLLRTLSSRLAIHVYELVEQPIDGRPLLAPGRLQALEFVEIGPGHPALRSMPAREDIKASRFAQGARCVATYRRGALLGYVWWRVGCYEEDEVRCTFRLEPAASSAFDFDVYVLPEHRLGTAFLAVWHGANQRLYAEGIRRSFSRVTMFNLASRRAHARLGAKRVGRAIFVRLGGVECMASTAAPYVGVSGSARRRLELRLAATQATGSPAL